jgi:hypothetical protein
LIITGSGATASTPEGMTMIDGDLYISTSNGTVWRYSSGSWNNLSGLTLKTNLSTNVKKTLNLNDITYTSIAPYACSNCNLWSLRAGMDKMMLISANIQPGQYMPSGIILYFPVEQIQLETTEKVTGMCFVAQSGTTIVMATFEIAYDSGQSKFKLTIGTPYGGTYTGSMTGKLRIEGYFLISEVA